MVDVDEVGLELRYNEGFFAGYKDAMHQMPDIIRAFKDIAQVQEDEPKVMSDSPELLRIGGVLNKIHQITLDFKCVSKVMDFRVENYTSFIDRIMDVINKGRRSPPKAE